MKGNGLKYGLIAAVLVVWGLIVYKLFFKTTSPATVDPVITYEETEAATHLPDTLILVANYRDPFLGKAPKKKTVTQPVNGSANRKNNTKKQVVAKQETPWPKIKYGGMVKNQNSEKVVALVQINGTDRLMTEGEVYAKVLVKTIGKDEVVVKFGKEEKRVGK